MASINPYVANSLLHKLQGLVYLSSQTGLWVHGVLFRDRTAAIEISFENWLTMPVLPGTRITYLGIWHPGPKSTLFEFQFGVLVKVPTAEFYQREVFPIMQALSDYLPPRPGMQPLTFGQF